MINTRSFVDGKELAAQLDQLRAAGASDEQRAALSVGFDGLAVTTGTTKEEFDELRAKVPEDASFLLVAWTVVHARLDF